MVYLERNARLLSEIREDFRIKKGTFQTGTPNTRFYSAGSFQSKELGFDVHVGLKERVGGIPSLVIDRLVFELAVMSVVAQKLPHLLPELPLFHGLLVNKNGEPLAIVTEDFSENGKNYVRTNLWDTPEDLRELFVKGTIDDIDFHPPFKVYPVGSIDPSGEIRKLGDFYPILRFGQTTRNAHREQFPEERIEKELDKYTIKIIHKL